MTQEQLAINAGIDEFSASARMSQYESGKHFPKYEIAQRLAAVLKIPVEYLYAADDKSAKLLLFWNRLSRSKQKEALEYLEKMENSDEEA
ncbi:helix-turn-helix domain-containing protein [Oxalobacter vibrioformis]|uniref:Helix-turn-helix domain-containing protein n=2 Tax=Oxalobacter vibrioformis TaxID=933080 RepID=A0A9E9LZE1_9BURK|nr:helix-turn-helix domain-containing protein [Oxalobacter vibrioformis]